MTHYIDHARKTVYIQSDLDSVRVEQINGIAARLGYNTAYLMGEAEAIECGQMTDERQAA